MGNSPFKCVSGGLRRARVLLPDGNLVLLEGTVEVASLMIDHPNHMVVHCSSSEPRAIGKRPSMTIMQPDQELEPGEAYLLHPIPPQYQKALFKSQPLSLSKRKMEILSGGPAAMQSNQDDDENQQNLTKSGSGRRRPLQLLTELLPRYQCAIGDSSSTNSEGTQTALLDSDSGAGAAGVPGQYLDEEEDEEVHLNLYMGWRPALESIPESPLGHNLQERPGSLFPSRPLEIAAA